MTATPSVTQTTPGPTAVPPVTADPAVVHANELGDVPVLMYHQLVATPKGDYDQTPAQFRAELVGLYRAGYRTITAADLVAGRVAVPAGRSPMVLTFDDSTVSQYGELPGGQVDPRTAVGILLDVARRFGEPHPVATFYVNAAPFAGKDHYLASLAKLGMELGDHTASHANLRQLDPAAVQRELAGGLAVITGAVPGARVTTMALPYGAHPHDRALASRGAGYRFAGVMLVGAGPARSPYRLGFDALNVPRIRSGNRSADPAFTSTYWLPRLNKTRFVSDGDPDVISFPRAEAGQLDPRFRGRAHPY
ncbi:MAG: polysaccharide deacetylase [Frankiales bacterium]|nr:polysaccharide deacetylase [Frankiales bacterium]